MIDVDIVEEELQRYLKEGEINFRKKGSFGLVKKVWVSVSISTHPNWLKISSCSSIHSSL